MAKAKFDIKTEAARPLYAGVGVTDLAVSAVRDYVADVQKKFGGVQKDVQARITGFEFEPKALRDQAVTVVSARVDALSKDAKARRAAIEARVAELQADARTIPTTVTGTYAELAKRGETLVERIRNQQATKDAKASAATTTAKAKTTKTQAKKAGSTTAKTAKKASTTAKKTSTAPKSSAKATATAAKKTAASTAQAATDAAEKVGD